MEMIVKLLGRDIMLFMREKMYLGSFCRVMFSEVIKIPIQSYEGYLENDDYKALNRDEYEAFCKKLPYFRNILVWAAINQKLAEGKINCTDEALGITLMTALQFTYEDNNYSDEELVEGLDSTLNCLEDFSLYSEAILKTVSEEEFLSEGYMFYACKSFADKFDDLLEGKFDPLKHGPLVCITNNNKNLIKDYFEKYFKRVNIVD
jgi:hypothetical protein